MEIPYTVHPREDTGLFNAKIGIWLFLASEVMLFGALFSSYILLRVGAAPGAWPHGLLNVPIGTVNTLVLISSSITVVRAWAALKMNDIGKFKMFMGLTVLCALIFVCIKSYEYNDKFTHYEVVMKDGKVADGHLIKQDAKEVELHGMWLEKGLKPWQMKHDAAAHKEIKIEKSEIAKMQNYGPYHNTYLAIYFTLTGLHALHVIGGALVLGYFWGPGSKMWKTDPERFTNRIEVGGLFWHFVDLVWIFLFPVLYLL